MKLNQQSLSRAIRRGNAVLAYDSATKGIFPVFRKGSTDRAWHWAKTNRSIESEVAYTESITKPLSREDILNSEDRNIIKL